MRVYLDTAPVIYLVENVAPWERAVRTTLEKEGVEPMASVLTRMECRVQPLRLGDNELLGDYEMFFKSLSGGLLELTAAVFDKAAELRAKWNLRTPDALHIATAILNKCDLFLTNDAALSHCTEIQVEALVL